MDHERCFDLIKVVCLVLISHLPLFSYFWIDSLIFSTKIINILLKYEPKTSNSGTLFLTDWDFLLFSFKSGLTCSNFLYFVSFHWWNQCVRWIITTFIIIIIRAHRQTGGQWGQIFHQLIAIADGAVLSEGLKLIKSPNKLKLKQAYMCGKQL